MVKQYTSWLNAAMLCLGFVSATAQAADANLEAGRLLFMQGAQPACAVCHTFADAGAAGEIGPSLDELKPNEARVIKALKTGIGQMPAYTALTDEQMQILARYIAQVTQAK